MFITLEGPDGSGKTSQVQPLVEYLKQQGFDLLAAREPGGTDIGNQVREVLMNLRNKEMHPRTEILLFCSARAQIVEEVVRPQLNLGRHVLLDRYADSTLAYQGYGHGINRATLHQLLDFVTGGLWPDLTVLLDVDAETGLQRRLSSHGEWNRLDDYDLDFHKRVRQGYLEMARNEPARWRVIDAGQPPEKVQQELRQVILAHLRKNISQ